MKRFSYSILVLIISIFSASAQNNTDAEKIINNLLTSVKTSAIRTNFNLKITEKNALNSQSNSGIFTLKGDRFVLEMDETKAWFDGKTQWAYMVQNNEVSITEPTAQEVASINPMAILSGYKAKSVVRFSKKKSAQNHIIEMRPKQKNNDFTLIEVQINKSNQQLVSVLLTDKNGLNTMLSLSNYQKGFKVTDDFFQFNKSKYKNVVINDLR
jgi:outer membrane lipoprotein-sorting protein